MPGEIARSAPHTPSALRSSSKGRRIPHGVRANAPRCGRRFRRPRPIGPGTTGTPARSRRMDGRAGHAIAQFLAPYFARRVPPRAILSRAGKMRRRIMTRTVAARCQTRRAHVAAAEYPYERTAKRSLIRARDAVHKPAYGVSCATRIANGGYPLRDGRLHAMAAQGFFRPDYAALRRYSTWPRVRQYPYWRRALRILRR